eukprot:scaffold10660_cov176-Amphora_coffeaeformis.AAC.11
MTAKVPTGPTVEPRLLHALLNAIKIHNAAFPDDQWRPSPDLPKTMTKKTATSMTSVNEGERANNLKSYVLMNDR